MHAYIFLGQKWDSCQFKLTKPVYPFDSSPNVMNTYIVEYIKADSSIICNSWSGSLHCYLDYLTTELEAKLFTL